MTDIHAALGLSQIKRLDTMIKKRHLLAKNYFKKLDSLPIKLPFQNPDSYSSFHLFVIRLDLESIRFSQEEVFNLLKENEIFVNLHYMPVYYHPYFRKLGFKKGYCPEAEKYYSETMSIPMYSSLLKKDQNKVIKVLNKIFK